MTCDRIRSGCLPLALLVAALGAPVARADEPVPVPVPDPRPPRLSFSGFGTLGVVHSSEKDADFTSTRFKPDGAGHSHDWSAAVDSLIGAQLAVRATPKLSAVVQVIAEQNYDDTYWPHVEWANVMYRITPDLSVRVGRTLLPTFLVSDVRQIAYANPWVRPPIEVYGLNPLTTNDGVDVSYRTKIGSATNTLQVNVGRSNAKFPSSGLSSVTTAKSRRVLTFSDTFERGFLTARLNYGQTRFTIPEFAPLFDAFRQFGPEGVAIADLYDVDGRRGRFVGIGATYDPGEWFAMGEWGHVRISSVFGESTGWYVSGGYRIRRIVTPYVTLGRLQTTGNLSDPGLSLVGLPPPLAGAAAGLNDALNGLLASKATQTTVSVGGRWDFRKAAALKLQLDHSRHGEDSSGLLTNLQPAFRPGEGFLVFSASIDVVF